MVWFRWWWTTNFFWYLHSKYSLKNICCINCCGASAAKIIKANLHKRAIGTQALDSLSVSWLVCLLVTSLVRRLLRHPPPGTSPAPQHSFQLWLFTSRRDLPALPKLNHTATIPFYSIVCFRHNEYLWNIYTLRKNKLSLTTVPETIRFVGIITARRRKRPALLIGVR